MQFSKCALEALWKMVGNRFREKVSGRKCSVFFKTTEVPLFHRNSLWEIHVPTAQQQLSGLLLSGCSFIFTWNFFEKEKVLLTCKHCETPSFPSFFSFPSHPLSSSPVVHFCERRFQYCFFIAFSCFLQELQLPFIVKY